MPLSGQFVTEGSVKADELSKDGAMMDGGEMAQIRASTAQQKTEEVFYAALQQLSLSGGAVAWL